MGKEVAILPSRLGAGNSFLGTGRWVFLFALPLAKKVLKILLTKS